jgi:hypothetical protein
MLCIVLLKRGSLHKLRPVQEGLRVERMDSIPRNYKLYRYHEQPVFQRVYGRYQDLQYVLSQTEITALYNYDGLNEPL